MAEGDGDPTTNPIEKTVEENVEGVESSVPAVESAEGEGDPITNICEETGGSDLVAGKKKKRGRDGSSSDDSYIYLGYPLDFCPHQKEKMAKWKDDGVCTFLGDFLCVLPMKLNQTWDEMTKKRVSAGLTVCRGGEKDNGELFYNCPIGGTVISETEDTVTIDIRGRYLDDAIVLLINHLLCAPNFPNIKFLRVIVGCIVHGVGAGKLREAVTSLLRTDTSITFREEDGGSIVSIKLDPKKDYMKLYTVYFAPKKPQD